MSNQQEYCGLAAEQPRPLLPRDYKSGLKPVWCKGCGDYVVLNALTKALAELQLPRQQVAFLSGIGCSSRIPAYTSVYGFHAVHGRALAVASGLKAARPDLNVLVAGGDGDGFSIGGNHFIHTCRRNPDLTYMVMDNAVYGMTKGQASPTTAADWIGSQLTPHGTGIAPFNPLQMGLAAGASFVARAFTNDTKGLAQLLVAAIRHHGFSLIQILSPCVTYRHEQLAYKDVVHQGFDGNLTPTADRKEAFRRLLGDDGFSTGIVYQAEIPVFSPKLEVRARLTQIESQFGL